MEPEFNLTWKRERNAVWYELNGRLIAVLPYSNPEFAQADSVKARIERFPGTELADVQKIWDERKESK